MDWDLTHHLLVLYFGRPPYILQPPAWIKVLPPPFLTARDTALQRARGADPLSAQYQTYEQQGYDDYQEPSPFDQQRHYDEPFDQQQQQEADYIQQNYSYDRQVDDYPYDQQQQNPPQQYDDLQYNDPSYGEEPYEADYPRNSNIEYDGAAGNNYRRPRPAAARYAYDKQSYPSYYQPPDPSVGGGSGAIDPPEDEPPSLRKQQQPSDYYERQRPNENGGHVVQYYDNEPSPVVAQDGDDYYEHFSAEGSIHAPSIDEKVTSPMSETDYEGYTPQNGGYHPEPDYGGYTPQNGGYPHEAEYDEYTPRNDDAHYTSYTPQHEPDYEPSYTPHSESSRVPPRPTRESSPTMALAHEVLRNNHRTLTPMSSGTVDTDGSSEYSTTDDRTSRRALILQMARARMNKQAPPVMTSSGEEIDLTGELD